jgi:hypothetical protein
MCERKYLFDRPSSVTKKTSNKKNLGPMSGGKTACGTITDASDVTTPSSPTPGALGNDSHYIHILALRVDAATALTEAADIAVFFLECHHIRAPSTRQISLLGIIDTTGSTSTRGQYRRHDLCLNCIPVISCMSFDCNVEIDNFFFPSNREARLPVISPAQIRDPSSQCSQCVCVRERSHGLCRASNRGPAEEKCRT